MRCARHWHVLPGSHWKLRVVGGAAEAEAEAEWLADAADGEVVLVAHGVAAPYLVASPHSQCAGGLVRRTEPADQLSTKRVEWSAGRHSPLKFKLAGAGPDCIRLHCFDQLAASSTGRSAGQPPLLVGPDNPTHHAPVDWTLMLHAASGPRACCRRADWCR